MTIGIILGDRNEGEGPFQIHVMRWFRSNNITDGAGNRKPDTIIRLEVLVRIGADQHTVQLDRRGTLVLVERIIHVPLTEQLVDEVTTVLHARGASSYTDVGVGVLMAVARFEASLVSKKLERVGIELSRPIGSTL